jgi:PAS domain S-box-containing protein
VFLAPWLGTLLLGSLVHLHRHWQLDRALLRGALETTPDAFNRVDDSGRILEVNPGMETLTGYSRAELVGKYLHELRPDEPPEEMAAGLAGIRALGRLRYETRWRRKDGTEIDLEVSAAVAPPEVGGFYAFLRDITERIRGEAALRESEARLSEFFDHAGSVMWIKDTEGRFLRINPLTERLVGRPREAILGRTVAELFPADEAAAFADNDRQVLAAGAPREFEETLQAPDGTHALLATKFPLRDSRGTVHGLGAICVDITARKQAEAALRLAEILQRAILDNIPDPAWLKDVTGRFLAVNQAYLGFFGKERAEILGHRVAEMLPGDEARQFDLQDEQILRSGTPTRYEDCLRDRQGRLHWFETVKARFEDAAGVPQGTLGIAREITERRRMEQSLRQSEERFRGTLDALIEGCQIIGFDWRYTYVNAAAAASGRSTVEALVGRTMMEAYPGIEDTPLFASLRRCMDERAPQRLENEFRFPDGTTGWFELVVQPVPEGIFILSLDVTDRKRAEASLRESEERYRLVAESTTDVIWLYDFGTDRFSYVSSAVERLRGYPAAEVLRQTMAEVLTPASYQAVSQRLPRRIADLHAGDESARTQTHEIDQTRRDGSVVPTEVVSTLITDSAGRVTHLQGVTRDITERRRAEAALREGLLFRREAERIGRIGAWKVSPQTDYLYWTEGVYEILELPLDYRPGLAEGLSFYDTESLPILQQALGRALEEGSAFTIEIGLTTRTGRHIWTEVRGLGRIEEGGQSFVMGTFQDITERRRAEKAIQEQAERLRLALDASQQGLYDLNLQTGVAVVNEDYVRMLGYDPADFHETNQAWIARLHPDDLAPITAAYRDYLAGRCPEYRVECRQRTASGDWIWIQSMGRIVSRTPEGNPLRMLGTHLNITERKEAEERSRRLRNLGLAVAGLSDRGSALHLSLEAALAIAGVEAGGIYLVDEATGDLDLHCHTGLSDAFVDAVRHFAADAPNARWARRGQFFHGSVDVLQLPSSESERAEGLKALSLLPILDEGRLVAVLNIASHRVEEVSARARTDLESVAGVIGGVLRRLHAEEALHTANVQLEQRVAERTRELASSEARLRHLLEMVPLPLGVANHDGNLTLLNRHHLRTFGYTLAEVPTLEAWWQRAYPDGSYRRQVRERWDAAVARAAGAGTEIEPLECRVTCRDGSVRDVVVSGIELDSDILATFLDLTELRKADAMLRTLRSALEQSPSVVVVTDREGTIQYANPRFEIQTGYRPDEAIGRNPRMLKSGVHPPEFYRQLWKTLLAGEIWRGELCNRRKDGTLFWESTAIAPVHDAGGVLTHYVAIKEDTTERRRTADELRLAKEAAEAANRAKSRFLANMSHEIRTPMNAILGFAQLLRRDPGLSDHHRQHLRTINRSGEHLLRLINDILDMSKIEAGRLQPAPAPCDFHGLIDDMAGLFRTRAEEKGLRFEVHRAPRGPRPPGHRRRPRPPGPHQPSRQRPQVHRHRPHRTPGLPRHAAHHHPRSPPPAACASMLPTPAPGIASEELERLFEPFEQAQAGRHLGGTGLGLAISRQLARLLGGDLVATSEPGAGSTFRFTFAAPVVDDGPSDGIPDPAAPRPSRLPETGSGPGGSHPPRRRRRRLEPGTAPGPARRGRLRRPGGGQRSRSGRLLRSPPTRSRPHGRPDARPRRPRRDPGDPRRPGRNRHPHPPRERHRGGRHPGRLGGRPAPTVSWASPSTTTNSSNGSPNSCRCTTSTPPLPMPSPPPRRPSPPAPPPPRCRPPSDPS